MFNKIKIMNTGHNFLNINDFDNKHSEHKICHNYYNRRDSDKNMYNNITPISSIENEYYNKTYYSPRIKVTEYREKENTNSNYDINKNLYTPIEQIENNSYPKKSNYNYENYYPSYSIYNKNMEKYDNTNNKLTLSVKKDNFKNNGNPHVFGPPLWFILHISAANYPDNPSTVAKKNMEYIIKGLPVLIPCQNCKEHATAHIEKHIHKIPEIVSSKKKVFEFFVQFHNQVNQRHGKEIMSVEDAYKLYSGEIENKITYS